MTTLHIAIDDDLDAFVRSQVSKRGFRDVSAYLQDLLRQARQREDTGEELPQSANDDGPAPWEIALAAGAHVPEAVWSTVPTDLARNLDHYLYGQPREE